MHGHERRILGAATAVAFAAGALARLWLLTGDRGALTGDEAVVGLMARHLVRDGDVDAFFWGQHYGGTLESILTAPFLAVLGTTAPALRIVPILLTVGSCALTYVLARRFLDAHSALAVAALMWVWPANLVWHTSRAWGFYGATLLLGLAFVELTLRIVDEPAPWHRWLALAGVGGLAWWTSPQSIHLLLPALVWLAARRTRHTWRLLAIAPIAAIAASPWLVHNLRTGFASLDQPDVRMSDGYLGNIGVFFHEALPVTFGLNMNQRWVVPLGALVHWVVVAALAAVLLRRHGALGPVALALLAYPLVYAVFPLAAAVGEGRYTLYALPLLAIVLVLGVDRHVTRALLLCAATVLTIATLPSAASSGAPMSPDAKEPPAIGPLVDALDDAGVDHVWASYHTAYRIAFHSDERIVAAAHVAGRWLPYQHDVAADERPAWVFPAASPQGGDFGRGLDALHERYDTITVPGFVAYWPHERVVAARVLAAGQLDGRRRTVDP